MQRFQGRASTSVGSAILALAALSSGTPAHAQLVHTRLARMEGAQEVPPVVTTARGLCAFTIDTVANTIQYRTEHLFLSAPETAAHIHGFAARGATAAPLFSLPPGPDKCGVLTFTDAEEPGILAGLAYVNIHSTAFPGGEIRGQIDDMPAHQQLCFGDGTGQVCPCGNYSPAGEEEGCLNSLGTGGRLRAYGEARFSADTLVLHHSRGPDSMVLLFSGSTAINSGGGSAFGDGKRCVTGGVTRLGIKAACAGMAYWPGPNEPGLSGFVNFSWITTYYQAWYRNPANFCTASTFNYSNAIGVVWGT